MLPVSVYFSLVLGFSFFLLFVVWVLSGVYLQNRVKMSPFECGFDPKDTARLPFSVRFFLLAVVFLVFDIEVALIFPLVYGVKYHLCGSVVVSGVGFLLILVFGLLHEWRSGALSWVL